MQFYCGAAEIRGERHGASRRLQPQPQRQL